jgi:hypothetical protein
LLSVAPAACATAETRQTNSRRSRLRRPAGLFRTVHRPRGDALVTGGIGGNISGVLVPRWDADERIKFAVIAGSGIGRYIDDLSSLGGQDAVYDAVQVSLRALLVSSGYVGYEHAWSPVFTTAVTYGVVNVSNLDIQLEDAFHRTQRTSINLMWNPVPFVDIVVEFLAGTRVNKNALQAAVRSGLVRKDDVQFPLNWYVEKRLCPHKKLLLAYIAENSTIESKQFFESLDAWQRCPSK